MKIQNKIIIISCIALLALIATSTAVNINNMQQAVSNRVQLVELPATLGKISGGISREILPAVITSKALANNSYVHHWLETGEEGSKYQEFVHYLNEVKESNSAVAIFLVSEQSKKFYYEGGILKTISTSSQKDHWYFDFIKSNKEFALNIDIDENTGNVSVFVNYRIESKGKLLGVGGIGISLDAMASMVGDYRIGDAGNVFLIDKKGIIKVHSNNELLGKSMAQSYALEAEVEKSILTGNNAFESAYSKVNKEQMIFSSVDLGLIDWILVAEVSEDNLYSDVNRSLRNGTFISVVVAIIFLIIITLIIRALFAPINVVANALVDIGQGDQDLTQRINYTGKDEVGLLAEGFNNFVEKIEHVVRSATDISAEVDKQVAQTSNQLSQAVTWAQDQEVMTEQITTAITEMEASSAEVAENATDATVATDTVSKAAKDGRVVIKNAITTISDMSKTIGATSETITHLAKDVDAISLVVDVIQGISEQINLLALNAAIEAARAGEYGRGFAVVADEVRSLSQRTRKSTQEIIDTIQSLEAGSNEAVQAIERGMSSTNESTEKVNQAGDEFEQINQAVSSMSSMNFQIATATNEQTVVITDVSKNMVSIADIARNSSIASSDNEKRFTDIKERLQDLSNILGQFKTH